MIQVWIDDWEAKEFHSKEMALRFMYGMQSRGHLIQGWSCDDPEDNEWLNRRFKL